MNTECGPLLTVEKLDFGFSSCFGLGPRKPFLLLHAFAHQRTLRVAHVHGALEFGICLGPRGRMYLDGAWYPLSAGDAYFLDAMAPHGHDGADLLLCEIRAEAVSTGLPLKYDLRLYEPFVALRTGLPPVIPKAEQIGRSLREAMRIKETRDPDWAVDAWPRILDCLAAIARHARAHGSGAATAAQHHAAVMRALQFIHERFTHDLSVADLARHCALSPSRMAHLFRDVLHTSPIDYRNRLRIGMALELLSSSESKASTVAAECGFESFFQFSSLFKRITGLSPREFRRRQRAAADRR